MTKVVRPDGIDCVCDSAIRHASASPLDAIWCDVTLWIDIYKEFRPEIVAFCNNFDPFCYS
jgi:hypothetical protein